jgi:hypothetical protein
MNTNDERNRELIEEITRYLATVDVFRSVGCEPTWRPETVRPAPLPEQPRPAVLARRAH